MTFPTYGCSSSTVRSLLLKPHKFARSHPTENESTSHLLAFVPHAAVLRLLCHPWHCYHLLGLVVSSKGPQAVAVLVPKCTVLAGGGSLFRLCSSMFSTWSVRDSHHFLPRVCCQVSENCPLSVSFTTAGDFPLRLCFDNLVKGLAFTECFDVQTHPSLLPRVQHFPKTTMLAHWANHLSVLSPSFSFATYKHIVHVSWAATATQMPTKQFCI